MSTYLKEKNIELKVDSDKDTVQIIVEGEESKYALSLKSQSLKQNLIRNLMIILDTNDRDFVKGIVDKEYRWLIRHKEEANLMITGHETPTSTPPPQEIYNINNIDSLSKSLKKSFKNEFKILKELIINNNQDPTPKNNNDTELIKELREEIYYLDKELRSRLSSEEKDVKRFNKEFAEERQHKEEMMKGYCHRIDEFEKEIESLKKENENLKEENEDLREELKTPSLSPEEESEALKELRENLEKKHQEEITAIEKKNKDHLKFVSKRNREDEKELQDQIDTLEESEKDLQNQVDKLEETIQSITQN